MDRGRLEGKIVTRVHWDAHFLIGGGRMVKRIVILEKGVEKKDLAAMACCTSAPTGKLAR